MITQTDQWLLVKYDNFDASIEEKYLRVIFRPLRDYAPSDAVFIFKVEKRGHLFRGSLEIHSLAKNFVSTCFDKEIYSLADKAKKDMTWQIDAWKHARSMNVAI